MKSNKQLVDDATTAIRELLHRHDREIDGLPRQHGNHAIAHLNTMWRALDGHTDVDPPLKTAKLIAALS